MQIATVTKGRTTNSKQFTILSLRIDNFDQIKTIKYNIKTIRGSLRLFDLFDTRELNITNSILERCKLITSDQVYKVFKLKTDAQTGFASLNLGFEPVAGAYETLMLPLCHPAEIVEQMGVEPISFSLQTKCSAN